MEKFIVFGDTAINPAHIQSLHVGRDEKGSPNELTVHMVNTTFRFDGDNLESYLGLLEPYLSASFGAFAAWGAGSAI
jgi:hypothetical protein